MPSIVVTSQPSAWTASTVQDFTASPSRWTVQAPQLEVSQPTCVPVSPRLSRRKWTSSNLGSTSSDRRWPFTVTETRTASAISGLSSPSKRFERLRLRLHDWRCQQPVSGRAHSHRQAALRAQRRRLADLEAVAAGQLQAVLAQDPRRDRLDLQLAEAHADALARTAAERDVGALRQRSPRVGSEALGAELVRVVPDVGQPVRGVGGVVDRRAFRHGDALELERAHGTARPDPGGRVEAQRLVE